MSDLMRLEVADGVGVLRFALPERRNPYSLGFIDALCAKLHEASGDDGVRAVVMTGGAHFCSGGELVEFRQKVSEGVPVEISIKQLGQLASLAQPQAVQRGVRR